MTTHGKSMKAGRVEFAGAQKTIFATGKAVQATTVKAMALAADSFGLGAVAGLDGEITVFMGKPYVTRVRGDGYVLDHGHDHGAVFAVWTRQAAWHEEPIPATLAGYVDLQLFVRTRAAASGIDTSQPFPFRLAGKPAQVNWHINVDLTNGQPIDAELFARCKANYVMKDEPVDIVGFYSESHPGVFISAHAPAIRSGNGVRNAIHIHLVSRDGKAAGHIDDLTLAPGMTLLLPRD